MAAAAPGFPREQSVEPSVAPSAEFSADMKNNHHLAIINAVEPTPQKKYDGPLATINAEGHVVNTVEVQDAINAFNAFYQAQLAATAVATQAEAVQHQAAVVHQAEPEHHAEHIEQDVTYSQQYTGPLATVNSEGLIQNTAEVEAAAKAFFEAYSAQLALTRASQEQSFEQYVEPSVGTFVEVSSNQKYNGPLATINAEGLVENTAEVKAATQAFFDVYNAQLALARASQKQSVEQSFEPSVETFVDVSSNEKYNGPLATINAEGLVEETAEVK